MASPRCRRPRRSMRSSRSRSPSGSRQTTVTVAPSRLGARARVARAVDAGSPRGTGNGADPRRRDRRLEAQGLDQQEGEDLRPRRRLGPRLPRRPEAAPAGGQAGAEHRPSARPDPAAGSAAKPPARHRGHTRPHAPSCDHGEPLRRRDRHPPRLEAADPLPRRWPRSDAVRPGVPDRHRDGGLPDAARQLHDPEKWRATRGGTRRRLDWAKGESRFRPAPATRSEPAGWGCPRRSSGSTARRTPRRSATPRPTAASAC